MFLGACGTAPGNKSAYVEKTEFWTWDTTSYFNKKQVARVVIYSDKNNGSSESNLYVNEAGEGQFQGHLVGKIAGNEAYEVAVLAGEHVVRVVTKKSLFSEEVDRRIRLSFVAGETYFVKANPSDMEVISSLPQGAVIKDKGSIHYEVGLQNRLKANVVFNNRSSKNDEFQKISALVTGNADEPKFFLNGKLISPESKVKRTYRFVLRFEPGDSELAATVKGLDDVEVTKKYTFHVKTEKEIAAEKAAALEVERKKAEAEKLKKIQLDKEAKARKAEEERIAREGDGSPDDLSCKKYGLKPQTQGYSECRMRLDLSRKEGERVQAANAKARDDARKAELERRYEEVQRQNAIVANRESKCRMVQSAEYAKPALGGFFESMNRANSAFDNCMAGVPQINTTCSKDLMGNINCTSR